MKRVLITGMSGTGKSTLVGELSARGYRAVDLDADAYSRWINVAPDGTDNEVRPGQDWVWDEARVAALLDAEMADVLFVSGCASNMGRFWGRFDLVVLLTAPDEVIVSRLATRCGDAYGQTPEEVDRALRLRLSIEPLLRKRASLEIDSSRPDRSACDELLSYLKLPSSTIAGASSSSPSGGG